MYILKTRTRFNSHATCFAQHLVEDQKQKVHKLSAFSEVPGTSNQLLTLNGCLGYDLPPLTMPPFKVNPRLVLSSSLTYPYVVS